jgi:hypothetical protein
MILAQNVVWMEEFRNAYVIVIGKPEIKSESENKVEIFQKQIIKVLAVFIWPRIGFSVRLF